jgi:kumamolisin
VQQRQQLNQLLSWPVQALLGVALLAMLLAGCSSPGSSSNSTNISHGTTSGGGGISPTPTPHPITSKPNTGKVSGGQQLPLNEIKPLTFNLVYNDTAMERDVTQIYTPGSPTYHQFLTPNQIVQRYALSDSQMQVVENWLTSHGFTIVSVDQLRLGIQVQASVATIERALNVQLRQYTINLFGSSYTFFVQENDPVISGPVSAYIQSVVGLDNFAFPVFRPPSGLAALLAARATGPAHCAGYGAKQTLTSSDLARAYQVNTLYSHGYQGQGMTIGVAEFGDPFDPTDVANYAACAGAGMPNIQIVNVDGQLAPGPGAGEATLDLEMIAGLAPRAQILDYQASLVNTSFAQALVDVFNKVAADDRVQVLSVSYGTGEASFSISEQDAINRSLRNLAAEGISVFISSGDCGAFSDRITNIAMVSFPASASYAIAVGGTRLQVNSAGVRTGEVAWGDRDSSPVCHNEWGSGGGVSQNGDFKRPFWQIGPGTTNHYDGTNSLVFTINLTPVVAPNGLRQVPDVSAAAFPNIALYYQGVWFAAGGTSAAAPIWAAGALLVDQALKQANKPLMGGVPTIYSLANHPGAFHPFTDITSGNNLFYPASKGWDYATGWGSPNFNDILQLLSQ